MPAGYTLCPPGYKIVPDAHVSMEKEVYEALISKQAVAATASLDDEAGCWKLKVLKPHFIGNVKRKLVTGKTLYFRENKYIIYEGKKYTDLDSFMIMWNGNKTKAWYKILEMPDGTVVDDGSDDEDEETETEAERLEREQNSPYHGETVATASDEARKAAALKASEGDRESLEDFAVTQQAADHKVVAAIVDPPSPEVEAVEKQKRTTRKKKQ